LELAIYGFWVQAYVLQSTVFWLEKTNHHFQFTFFDAHFSMGAFMLLPFCLIETWYLPRPQFTAPLIGSILYLGFGTSVAAFLCWNLALQKLGTSRTVLFGNLTTIFSTIEAVLILGENSPSYIL